MLLKLTDYGRDKTSIGFEQITIVKYGFDSSGVRQSVICKAQRTDGTWSLFTLDGDDIGLDLLMHYNIL